MYLEQYLGAFENYAERTALSCLSMNRSWTYTELDKITNQLSNRFREAGLKKGDVAMVCLYNTGHFPISMLASWKNLMIFTPINFRLRAGEMQLHLEDSTPQVFIYDAGLEPTVQKALEMSSHRPDILISTGRPGIPGAVSFEDYLKGASEEDPGLEDRIREIDPLHDELQRLYTSGTTGLPKGVKFTSVGLLAIVYSMVIVNHYTFEDKVMNITPWFHQGGIATGPQPMLVVGGNIFALKEFDPDAVLAYVEKYRLTVLFGAPITFNALVKAQQQKRRDLSSLRLIHSMGSPVSREEFLAWKEYLAPQVNNTYGTTETAGDLCLRSDLHPVEEKAGSAGRPYFFQQARVVKIKDGRTEPDELVAGDGQEEGQLIVKSLAQLSGYHNRPEEEAQKLYKGWFYSGDAAIWDADGFITITGRTDDMIISGGENVYPTPVEQTLERHPRVREAMVVGLPHEKWGQAVAAFIVPEGEPPSIEELNQHCLNDPYLAPYKRPRYYRFIDELPHTATGKKIHYLVVEQAIAERDKFAAIASEAQ